MVQLVINHQPQSLPSYYLLFTNVQDLAAFGERVEILQSELNNSQVYQYDCNIGDAWVITDQFMKRLVTLETEAHDLIELQELLEASVVNFRILPE